MKKATRQHTKELNIRFVLKTIYGQPSISRADISRVTHLTPTTVSEIVADMIEDGMVAETGVVAQNTVGKPPVYISIVDDSRQLVSVDLSGEAVCGALANLRGKIQVRSEVMPKSRSGVHILEAVYQVAADLLRQATSPVLGIGVSTPGLVDVEHGIILNAVNLDWRNIPITTLLSERYQLPIHLAKDTQAAALAEYMFGGQQANSLVLVKVGRGIGAGIVLNGVLYGTHNPGAGEIGHMIIQENGQLCGCGNYGCLETIAGVRAILQRAGRESLVSFEELGQAPQYRPIIEQAGAYLGAAIGDLVSILNISKVIIAGDVVALGPAYLDAVSQSMQVHTLAQLAETTSISYSTLGKDIGLLGATALVLANELDLP
jgi:predicted NBD/HSP70 family sugar kinase